MEGAVVIVLATLLVAALIRWATRPHTAIVMEEGRVRLVRGQPPRGLVHDLADVAESSPDASGRILLSGVGRKLHVEVVGLDESLGQRVRNVVLVHGRRIR